jgi:hypothetical protein
MKAYIPLEKMALLPLVFVLLKETDLNMYTCK